MKTSFFAALSAIFSIGLFACSTEVAGGSSEETNTVAGTLTLPSGAVASRIAIQMQSTLNSDSTIYADTTDFDGEFTLTAKNRGTYGISAVADSFAFYDTVSLNGTRVNRNAELVQSENISGNIYLRPNIPANGATVLIPGSPWKVSADSNGYFILKNIPQRVFSISVTSPERNYVLSQDYTINLSENDNSKTQSAAPYCWVLPLSPEYKIVGFWSFDNLFEGKAIDVRGTSGSAVLYGDAELVSAKELGNALHLNGAKDFAVIEEDRGVLDSAQNLTLETWVNVNDLKTKSIFVKNIFGKLGFSDSAVFSLAVLQDTCGVSGSAFAFFMAQGIGDTLRCENAAISKQKVNLGEWQYLVATWNGDSTRIYVDGILGGSAKTKFNVLVQKNSIPLYFGKEELDIQIDDVKLFTTAVEESDVLYRYQHQH